MYFVYILLSSKDGRTYVGYTKDLSNRLRLHNSGQVKATKNRRSLKLFLFEKFDNEQEAKKRELWWKSSSGRRRLREIFKQKRDEQ